MGINTRKEYALFPPKPKGRGFHSAIFYEGEIRRAARHAIDHPDRVEVLAILRAQADAVAALQDDSPTRAIEGEEEVREHGKAEHAVELVDTGGGKVGVPAHRVGKTQNHRGQGKRVDSQVEEGAAAEAPDLVEVGPNLLGRMQRLAPAAATQWAAMQDAAAADGIRLLIVSGYRSIDYQARLIRKKLNAGQSLSEILAVNAAPGYSEHHTGRAVDIATPGSRPRISASHDPGPG